MSESEPERVEAKECPRGHGPMRLRVRWGSNVQRGGRGRARGEAVREWQCPVCHRTLPAEE